MVRFGGKRRMLADRREADGDLIGREHQIDRATRDRTLRHARMLRGVLVLRERQAASGLDFREAQRAIRAGAGENHADRGGSLDRREGPEKMIDGIVRSPIVRPRSDREDAVRDGHAGVRPDHVDMIRRHFGPVIRVDDGHRRVRLQQLAKWLSASDRDAGSPPRPVRVAAAATPADGSSARPPADAPTPTTGNGCSDGAAIYEVYDRREQGAYIRRAARWPMAACRSSRLHRDVPVSAGDLMPLVVIAEARQEFGDDVDGLGSRQPE